MRVATLLPKPVLGFSQTCLMILALASCFCKKLLLARLGRRSTQATRAFEEFALKQVGSCCLADCGSVVTS